MNQNAIHRIQQLAKDFARFEVQSILELPGAGSNRKYYRIFNAKGESLLAAYNPNVKENRAFVAFSKHFNSLNLTVPRFLAIEPDEEFYLQEDLGDEILFNLLKKSGWTSEVKSLFLESTRALLRLQIEGDRLLDYTVAYPRAFMDEQSIRWDLNYFKYYFLKPVLEHLDEERLEHDFNRIVDDFNRDFPHFFMFRDFQSRNIMITNEGVKFIDYQGGRKGSPLYDLVSFVFQAKAEMPYELQQELIQVYKQEFLASTGVDSAQFDRELNYYRLVRFLQVLGAYGYRGYFEKKPHFLESIPKAFEQLPILLAEASVQAQYPDLTEHLLRAAEKVQVVPSEKNESNGLVLRIQSFSYRKGFPADPSGNGGGFAFDCRILPNPGREKEYQLLTGRDQPVIDYLRKLPEVEKFLIEAIQLVEQGVENYLQRGFHHLMVSFGCTGGQHRSVYCAEYLARHFEGRTNLNIKLEHLEQQF